VVWGGATESARRNTSADVLAFLSGEKSVPAREGERKFDHPGEREKKQREAKADISHRRSITERCKGVRKRWAFVLKVFSGYDPEGT